MAYDQKIKKLKERILDLKRQWPAHSIPPALLMELEDLEEELEFELKKAGELENNA